MKAYILSVCGAVIISSLAVILLPEGRMGKFINGILKLFCLLIMLIPLFSLLRDFSMPDQDENTSGIVLDENFIDYFYSQQASQEEEWLAELMKEEFSVSADVQIEWDSVEYAYERSKVNVKIENFGMHGDDEHILIISEIKARIAEVLQISSEVIEVYE